MRRRFLTLDVFTDRPLAGNPLAVVLDSQGLTDIAMQAIAGEFNLSETVFVFPPADPHQRAALRIFTPSRELPFAGHPTVGTAVLLGLLDHGQSHGVAAFGLEERVGLVPCAVEISGEGRGQATFTVPRLPERLDGAPSPGEVAVGLGLDLGQVGCHGFRAPQVWSAGVPYVCVPVSDLAALGAVQPDPRAWPGTFGGAVGNAYLFTRDPEGGFRTRMFASDLGAGIREDPATGSAAAAISGWLAGAGEEAEGESFLPIRQGYEMGRASEILLGLVMEEGRLARATIGGSAVIVAEGALRL
jgi:trans-2,3-dihydro-3-hydroxyanthranilate isomerase